MIIFLFVLCLLTAICSLYVAKDENANKQFKIKVIAIAEIIIGVLITGLSYYNDSESDKQHNRIERFDSLNNILAEKIKSLSILNNSIATGIKDIELDNRSLAIKNSKLSDSIRYIVNSIKDLTDKNNKLSSLIRNEAEKSYLENSSRGTLVFNFQKPVKSIKDITFICANGTFESTPILSIKDEGKSPSQTNFIPFKIGIQNNKVYLDAEVIDQSFTHIVSIEKNNWIVNPHIINRLNYDDNGFEVIDDMSNVLFSIDIFPDNKIKFQGFIYTSNIIIVAGDKKVTLINNIKSFKDADKYFKKLFVYTGSNWLHKRAK